LNKGVNQPSRKTENACTDEDTGTFTKLFQ
jgi:hypothetical protein